LQRTGRINTSITSTNPTLNITHPEPYKTLIITVWFGAWPEYLTLFLHSAGFCPEFQWLIISDNDSIPFQPRNVLFRKCSIEDFMKKVANKLGINVGLDNLKKICDFKPVLGSLFEEELKGFDYWGYSDTDIIFGRFWRHKGFTPGKYDIISGYEGFLSGPFCLFRNTPALKELYKKHPDHRKVLGNPEHLAFDENIPGKTSGNGRFVQFFDKLRYIMGASHSSWRPSELRYRYQWHVKRKTASVSPPADMTDIVYREMEMAGLSASFNDLIESDRSWKRQGRKKWEVRFEKGILLDVNRNREIFAFHFVDSKTHPDFKIKGIEPGSEAFTITENGIKS